MITRERMTMIAIAINPMKTIWKSTTTTICRATKRKRNRTSKNRSHNPISSLGLPRKPKRMSQLYSKKSQLCQGRHGVRRSWIKNKLRRRQTHPKRKRTTRSWPPCPPTGKKRSANSSKLTTNTIPNLSMTALHATSAFSKCFLNLVLSTCLTPRR